MQRSTAVFMAVSIKDTDVMSQIYVFPLPEMSGAGWVSWN